MPTDLRFRVGEAAGRLEWLPGAQGHAVPGHRLAGQSLTRGQTTWAGELPPFWRR